MNFSLRSPFTWISATILSVLLYAFAFHLFPQTFPIVNLSITMDLEQALNKADELTQKYNFAPHDYQSAAMFHTDNGVKTFVELEGGGNDAFIAMMDEKLYMPYTWQVRHFKEHEKNETIIIFTPDGQPYGFVETISENVPGAQLSEADAQKKAEHDAQMYWDIDFTQYTLVEASQTLEPSKRLDHTFIYERNNKKIGEGSYRLKIVISGDKMSTLHHFVKVPEAFNRRYIEMRSANMTISWIATLAMMFLYFIFGCGFGLFYLNRHRWNIIKQPMQWAIFLAALSVLVSLNQLPVLWMHYHSALSLSGFLTQLLLGTLIQFFGYSAFLTIIIIVAEGLTRRAFGHHPQLWLLQQSDVATSYAVLGRTIGGYLLVGFNCAFVMAFYYFSTHYLGWWSPSEMLFDPNILATYVPWFSPLAQSLNAGFMEECLFRAIPLAGAALLGNYFGKRNWWIGAAFILQAIVFGAAHANYPVQPAYARLVELLIPSLIWGAIYLRFGLLPTILSHFTYDVIWFSIPLFVSQAPHAFVYKMTIILITLSPLLYILYARIKRGIWQELHHSAFNKAWLSVYVEDMVEKPVFTPQIPSYSVAARTQKLICALGIVGLIAWIYATPFTHDGVTITLNRDEAIARSNAFLEKKNFIAHAPWKTLPLVFTSYDLRPDIALQHKFIWQEEKKELYHQLLGTYLHPAHWTIRYAQFDTDIIQRTEEYKIILYNDHIWESYHQLPETAIGKTLTLDEARAIVYTAIQEQFNLNPQEITEVSATSSQLPYRKDWLFIFENPAISLQSGQARVSVAVAGDQVIDAALTIHVPEEWERAQQHQQNMLMNFMIIVTLIFLFLLLLALYIASKQNRTFVFSKQLFFTLCGIAAIIFCIDIINSWPIVIGLFNTSLPFSTQLFQSITMLIIGILSKVIFYSGAISYVISQRTSDRLSHSWMTPALGICSGLLIAGIYSAIQLLVSANMPLWPLYNFLGCTIPSLANILHAIIRYTQFTVAFSLLFILIDTATHHWQKHCLFFTIFAAACGMSMIGLSSLDMIGMWIIGGVLFGWILLAMYRYIIRYNYALISLATGSFCILQVIQQGIFNAYPGALIHACINTCVITVCSLVWYRYSSR